MAQITDLPSELIVQISEYLYWWDVAQILRTCRRFAWLLTSVLYDPHLRSPDPPSFNVPTSDFYLIDRLREQLCRWTSEYILEYIRSLSLDCFQREERPDLVWAWLHDAAAAGNLEVVKILLAKGMDVNCLSYHKTALYLAVRHGHDAIVHLLLEAGADPLVRDHQGRLLLLQGAAGRPMPVMEFCSEVVRAAGCCPAFDPQGSEGLDLLDIACRSSASVVKFLLELGMNPVERECNGLRKAACSGNAQSCRLILDKIRPAAGGEWPDGVLDAFYIALKYKNADCALAFLKCDFDVLAPLPNGSNAFEFALQLGISPVIHEMLSLRPDLWQSTDFESVFQDSVENLSGFKRNYNTLNALIDLSQTGKLSLDFSSQDGTYHNYTPLHRIVAATRGIYDPEQPGIQCLQNLVGKAGADLTKVSHTGQTPLHLALRMSKVGFTKVLLRACITRAPDVIYMYDQQGHTPLHLAAMMTTGKGDMIAELIDAGADILACDARGESPLHLAARCPNNKENIDKLLEAGADIEGPNTLSLTPLQIAASVRDNTETIDALLAAGANSKATTTAGETPLHLAASISENAKVVERLLDAGADLSLRDSKGRTALHNAAGACVHVTRVLAGRVADIRALDNEGMPPQHISAVAGGGPGLRFWRFYDDGKGRWHQDCHVCGAEPLVEGDRDSDDDVGFELFDWY